MKKWLTRKEKYWQITTDDDKIKMLPNSVKRFQETRGKEFPGSEIRNDILVMPSTKYNTEYTRKNLYCARCVIYQGKETLQSSTYFKRKSLVET